MSCQTNASASTRPRVYNARMSYYDITPGNTFANDSLYFDRTPAEMTQLLVKRREGVSAVREKHMKRLAEIVGDERAIQLLSVVEPPSDLAPGPYAADAAEALNLADKISFEDTLVREAKLLEDMFAGQSHQSASMKVPYAMLHFAMESYNTAAARAGAGERFYTNEGLERVPATFVHARRRRGGVIARPLGMSQYMSPEEPALPTPLTLDDVFGAGV